MRGKTDAKIGNYVNQKIKEVYKNLKIIKLCEKREKRNA